MCAKKYWSNPNYLTINDHPYLSVYTAYTLSSNPPEKIAQVIDEMKQYSHSQYKIDPYLVGVATEYYKPDELVRVGFDALTGYAWLPDFKVGSPAIQQYRELLERRQKDWVEARLLGVPIVPPAVVGWDASARFEDGYSIDVVKDVEKSGLYDYPLVPIIVGDSAEDFERMLRLTRKFVRDHVPPKEQYNIICAWNEITEGCALLPQVVSGAVDLSYLQAVRRVMIEDPTAL